MTLLTLPPISSVAVIGAHCDDIAIGAGATLLALTRRSPDMIVNALVLTGAGTEREVEEKNAMVAMCGEAEVRLTVADLPDGHLPRHWGEVKDRIAEFRRTCDPDLVIGPQREDAHQDHRLVAELIPTEFRNHTTIGYEILKWETDLPSPNVYQPVSEQDAQLKIDMLHESYPSQVDRHWFDDEAFRGLMRIRGVQCHSRYAEAYVSQKIALRIGEPGVVPSVKSPLYY